MEETVYSLLLHLPWVVIANQDIDTAKSEDFFKHASYNSPVELVKFAGYFWNCQVSEILRQHLISKLDKAIPEILVGGFLVERYLRDQVK